MLNKNYVAALILLCAFSSNVSAKNNGHINNIKNKLGDIQESISQSQDTMQFERNVSGSTFVPEPEHSSDMPSYSYFVIESYDIFRSPSGKSMIQAVVTNNSGGGIELKPSQIKAYFGGQEYLSPSSIEQGGKFAQGETKSVTLHFDENSASILGLMTRNY
ncbi:hypothetical protein [Vibrio sp. AND4]|uniref:hypothetical protein n=1 Tax=Vibrio sp. AND4 TaxID=314289 RepID=UPI00015F0450|nr:hypothetical protein [Vibrio sp. AND4]EDP58015.1 hypothetical protein AND4_00165 [Vibrio sp. AND4]